MRFGLLGPIEVWAGGRRLPIDRPFRRAVLAYLLLHAGKPVPADRLIEALWGGAAPESARAQVHAAVSQIRRVLRDAGLADQLTTQPSGYRLDVMPSQLDLDVFNEHVVRARAAAPALAVEELRHALRLWRGPALGDAAASFVDAARAQLEDLRLSAHEDLLGLELGVGRHTAAAPELAALVDAHPLRERLTGHLMLALYRCGRQAEALSAYHRLRSRLAEQLGIDPGPWLRERHEAILRADPALDVEPARPPSPHRADMVPRQLPAPFRHFAGRAAELETLTTLIEPGATVVISAIDGMAGVGKTTMAVFWAHRVAERFPDGQLYVNLRGFDPTGATLTAADAVRGFLDALQVPAAQIPAGLDAQAALYRSLVAGRRMLVLLDNARSPDQVRPLLPGSAGCLVLVTSRNRLSGLIAIDGAHPVTLDLPSTEESRELLTRRLGGERLAAEPTAADDIVDLCARLPLALSIVASQALTRPRLPLSTLAEELRAASPQLDAFDGGDPAADVRSVLSWSYRQLDSEPAALFRLLGLHPGPDISAAAVASLAGVPPNRTHPILAQLTRANLIAEPTPGRFALHDLLRAHAAELCRALDDPAERTGAIHRILDHYLHSSWHAATRLNPHRNPSPVGACGPGVTPERPGATTEALAWFKAEHQVLLAIVTMATDAGQDRHVSQIAWTLVDFLQMDGHWHDWVATQRAALAATQRVADPAAQAYAHRNLASAYGQLGRYEEAEAEIGHALALYEELNDRAGQGYGRLGLSWIFGRLGQHGLALDHARAALDHYQVAGQPARQATALNTIGWYHTLLGDHQLALDHCQRALALQEEMGDSIGAAGTWDSLGHAHQHLGHQGEAIACFQRAIELFRQQGDRYYEADTLTHLGDAHVAFGEPAAAYAAWRCAHSILVELEHPDADDVAARLVDSAR